MDRSKDDSRPPHGLPMWKGESISVHAVTSAKRTKVTAPGCRFARPEIANATYTKTFYPHGLRPWDWEWEEPAWHHARFAIVMPWKKQQGSAPHPAGAPRPQTPSVGTSHTRHDTTWAVTNKITWSSYLSLLYRVSSPWSQGIGENAVLSLPC